ncbi:MAG: 2-oxoisovalerate dehydrogenase [Candidatus Sumerlaeota bacterium]|nr:2-oxoisovalerate dehydrogenase [Candidatus Sumerlaeota bacterium]
MKNSNEIIFLIEDAPEGGYTARALGHSIFTEADNWFELENNIREATECHFENSDEIPQIIRLHYTRKAVIAL